VRAVVLERHGGYDVLQLQDRPAVGKVVLVPG
jgi:hypothetical protein